MSVDQFFYEHPVFRYDEFLAWKMAQGGVKLPSVRATLYYYVKKGRIKSIRRGLYGVIPANQSPNEANIDPYLIAAKATEDAVVAYHSALELIGVAYSTFGQLTYLTTQKSKPFEFAGLWFQPVAQPAKLKVKKMTMHGVEHINRQGLSIAVTTPERTFVDVLNRIELCGGWEEVCRSIQSMVVLNVDEVIKYCLLYDSKVLNAVVGYFLSLRQGAFQVSDQQLEPLLDAVPKAPQYMVRNEGEAHQCVKPWNILLPMSVLNQTWEEPYANL